MGHLFRFRFILELRGSSELPRLKFDACALQMYIKHPDPRRFNFFISFLFHNQHTCLFLSSTFTPFHISYICFNRIITVTHVQHHDENSKSQNYPTPPRKITSSHTLSAIAKYIIIQFFPMTPSHPSQDILASLASASPMFAAVCIPTRPAQALTSIRSTLLTHPSTGKPPFPPRQKLNQDGGGVARHLTKQRGFYGHLGLVLNFSITIEGLMGKKKEEEERASHCLGGSVIDNSCRVRLAEIYATRCLFTY